MNRKVAAAAFISCVGVAAAAQAETVMWWVAHPQEMHQMLLACRNDPGRAKATPDCENVTQAGIVISTAQARAHFDMAPPSDPRYWRNNPEYLPQYLRACQHIPPNASPHYRQSNYCDSVEAAVKGK